MKHSCIFVESTLFLLVRLLWAHFVSRPVQSSIKPKFIEV